jgi:hypothetical protein
MSTYHIIVHVGPGMPAPGRATHYELFTDDLDVIQAELFIAREGVGSDLGEHPIVAKYLRMPGPPRPVQPEDA